MQSSTIYTIGYGLKKINDFIEELKSFDIKYVVDVRTKPYSKHNPIFSFPMIKNFLKNEGIGYIYMGHLLGGLPPNGCCRTEDGKIDYEQLKKQPFFLKGLERILKANKKGIKIALMCSEADPKNCHRSKLIGEALRERGIIINHIVDKNKIKSQITVIQEVSKGPLINLFGDKVHFTSRKKYVKSED